jgi:hypothetical protein
VSEIVRGGLRRSSRNCCAETQGFYSRGQAQIRFVWRRTTKVGSIYQYDIIIIIQRSQPSRLNAPTSKISCDIEEIVLRHGPLFQSSWSSPRRSHTLLVPWQWLPLSPSSRRRNRFLLRHKWVHETLLLIWLAHRLLSKAHESLLQSSQSKSSWHRICIRSSFSESECALFQYSWIAYAHCD